MAIANTTLKCTVCGKEFEIRKKCFNRTEATNYENWAADHFDTCPECWRAAKQAAEDQKLAIYNLPTLTGSEKQIKWASDIRRTCVEQLDRLYTARAKSEEKKAKTIEFIALLGEHTDSRWWIDNRYYVSDITWIVPHINELAAKKQA